MSSASGINGLNVQNDALRSQVKAAVSRDEARGGRSIQAEIEQLAKPPDLFPKSNPLEGFKVINKRELSLSEKMELRELQQLERSVRRHERAHSVTARDLAISGPSFEYKRGPDGQKYAVHGEVNIDSSPVVSEDPQATIEKALKIQRAALAPTDPSPKDISAAARARIIESKAHRQLARQKMRDGEVRKENEKENPGEQILNHPGVKIYHSLLDFQEGLFKILDLFS